MLSKHEKPAILCTSAPWTGHFIPVLKVARELHASGYDVSFLNATCYESQITSAGLTFYPFLGAANPISNDVNTAWEGRELVPPGLERVVWDAEHFVDAILPQHESLTVAIGKVEERTGRPVVVLSDALFLGTYPGAFGAPGKNAAGYVGLGLSPLFQASPDVPPLGLGMPYDTSPEGLERNKKLHAEFRRVMASPQKKFYEAMKTAGKEVTVDMGYLDGAALFSGRYVQLGAPSLEYPRSDLPKGFRFAGGAPEGQKTEWKEKPLWWDELVTSGKKVVFVAQGSLYPDTEILTMPTIRALKDEEDIVIIAAIGAKGSSYDGPLPDNTKILDYVPYEHVLPVADVFVTNGGFGGVSLAARHGVPMVISGITEDHPECAARAAWAGIAIDLKAHSPEEDKIYAAVRDLLKDENGKWSKRCEEVKREAHGLDPMKVIEEAIQDVLLGED